MTAQYFDFAIKSCVVRTEKQCKIAFQPDVYKKAKTTIVKGQKKLEFQGSRVPPCTPHA